MKIEIEKREYDRLKSREEKLLAYYEWWREWEWMELNSIEEVINDNIRLREENKKLKEKYDWLTMYPQDMKELKEENIKLKEFLNITVQTKNEKIRNLLEELEYYKKQCGED